VDEQNKVKIFIEWLKNPKNKVISQLLALFAMGFLFLSLSKFIIPSKPISRAPSENPKLIQENLLDEGDAYKAKLEKQLVEILGKVKGVGEVDVAIALENETQVEPAFNVESSERTTDEKDNEGGVRTIIETQSNKQAVVLRKGGEDEPLVLKKMTPQIKGVLIVAEGASSSSVVEKITKATATLLDIPLYKVKVLAQ
jgi:stage III sporulation protein AG